jgi:hypothetical protein
MLSITEVKIVPSTSGGARLPSLDPVITVGLRKLFGGTDIHSGRL